MNELTTQEMEGPRGRLGLLRAGFVGATHHLRAYWLLWLVVGGIAAAAGIGMDTGLARLYQRWRFAYDHSLLVIPMAAWLLVVSMRRGSVQRLAPSLLGYAGLMAIVAVYALAEAIDFTLGMQAVMPLVLWGALTALMGLRFGWYAAIPTGFLYFAIPVWDLTEGVLQDISTWAVSAALRVSDITAQIDVHYITIPYGTFEIAEGCAGLSYVLVGLTLAVFYAMNWLRRWRTRLLLVVIAGLASMVANWVRIYTLILIGYWTRMEHYLISVSHDEFGWVVFILIMAPVFLFARWLEARDPVADAEPPAQWATQAASPVFLVNGALIAALVASPALLGRGPEPPDESRSLDLITAPGDDWIASAPAYNWSPAFVSPHGVGRAAFTGPQQHQVDVYLARYFSRRFDSKLIASRNELAPHWQAQSVQSVKVAIEGRQRTVQETRLERGTDERLMWSWYVVGGHTAHEAAAAKLLAIPAVLLGRRDGSVIAVSALCRDTCAGARAAMKAFVAAHGDRLESVANGAANAE